MDRSDQQPHVSVIGVIIAFLIPIAVAGLAVIRLAQAGPHDVVLAGVPRDHLQSVHVASVGDATVSRDEAIERAREKLPGFPDGWQNAGVRQVQLGRYSDQAAQGNLRGKLVWLVNFAKPDEIASGFFSGPFGTDHSCDWAYHYKYVLVVLDATSGDFLWSGEAAFPDPSRPPREKTFVVTPDERERCEQFFGRRQQSDRSP